MNKWTVSWRSPHTGEQVHTKEFDTDWHVRQWIYALAHPSGAVPGSVQVEKGEKWE